MRQKQLVLKKLQELQILINGEKALISTNRSREELLQQLQKMEQKLLEAEVLVNRENEEWS
jgi:antitoxin component of MazEF toxin-antitoxin module